MNKKSGHWTNTGMAKFINDNLYNYDSNNEKSMNPFRWYRVQNGEDVSNYRETINGFPCRLILVNDGETPLNEGQNEPTPGNTKDMGIFNFNNDKDNVTTLGFDSDIFPNCASYEVTANSDTSAGAFMSYRGDGDEADELAYLKESFELRHPDADDVAEDWGFMGLGEELGDKFALSYYSSESDNTYSTQLIKMEDVVNLGINVTYKIRYFDANYTRKYATAYMLGGRDIADSQYAYFSIVSDKIPESITLNDVEYKYVDLVNETTALSLEPIIIGVSDYVEPGLKALIDWVDNCTDEEFVADFEEHFHKDYTLRYYCLVVLCGMVDNLGGQYSCRV